MSYGLTFSPFLPLPALIAVAVAAALLAGLLIYSRTRGSVFRALALLVGLLALANPSFTREEREPLSSVVAVVVDKSQSQSFGERTQQTEAARAQLAERLGKLSGVEVRTIEADAGDGSADGTRLFSALSAGLADVPPERVAGAIMITDGRVHDTPENAGALGFSAPVHALITGRAGERDRRVALEKTPRFGIVGQKQTVTFKVTDEGARILKAREPLARKVDDRILASLPAQHRDRFLQDLGTIIRALDPLGDKESAGKSAGAPSSAHRRGD